MAKKDDGIALYSFSSSCAVWVVDGGGGERRGRVPCQNLCCGYRKTLAQSERQRKNERKQELSGNELIGAGPQCAHVTKLGTV